MPCVIGVGGLMETLTDGEWVEMDGASGIVRRIGHGDDGAGCADASSP